MRAASLVPGENVQVSVWPAAVLLLLYHYVYMCAAEWRLVNNQITLSQKCEYPRRPFGIASTCSVSSVNTRPTELFELQASY